MNSIKIFQKVYSGFKIVLIMMVCSTLTILMPSFVFCKNIDIRVSVKIIVDPVSGNRPDGITHTMFNNAEDAANQWQASYYRGYRFRITEIVEIGGPDQGGATGPSKWFNMDLLGDNWDSFKYNVNTDDRYQKRSDQVNFYVSTAGPAANSGGACPIPPDDCLACFGRVNNGAWWLNHELGHFFALRHTHQGENRDECIPGDDDGIADTLADVPAPCWTSLDDVANYHYSMSYVELNSLQKKLVSDTYFNVMSYHEAPDKDLVENRMTELQLDRIADTANGVRFPFVSGKTWFIKPEKEITPGAGDSKDEFQLISRGVTAANNAGGDILMLRPGIYLENLTISKPMTIRATRAGPVFIGN